MIFTDADFVTSADLSAIDGEIGRNIIGNATTLGVTLDGPGSIIRRAIEESGTILMAKFQSYSGYVVGGGSSAHWNAVNTTGGNNAVNRPRVRLAQVVAVDPDPSKIHLQNWVEYRCLAATFRAVFRRFTGKDYDRYVVKVNDYDAEATRAASLLWSVGLPVITIGGPLDCPGALRQLGAGTFSTSNLQHGGSGSTDTGSTWYVAITYTGAPYISPLVKGNAESGPSLTCAVTTLAAERITVSLAGLTPPTGDTSQVGNADGVYISMAATGWNVYCGPTATALRIQNATPIPIATTTYTLANAPTTTGALLTPGQYSTANYAAANLVMRG